MVLDHDRLEVRMPPNSALTRFIKQGLARGVCPLCRVAYKLDGEYMWAFFDEYSQSTSTLDALRRSCGLCGDHAERLRRLEVDGLHSNLGISAVYLDTLRGLLDQLKTLEPGAEMANRDKCPACAYRDEEVERNARYLLDEVRENPSSRERLLKGSGLCFPHFELVWRHADERADRELLLELERRAVADLVRDLTENIRKQGHEYPGDPDKREADSWQLAIQLTTGWSREALRDEPPPPERRYQLPSYARVRPEDGAGPHE
jgi:hypothetical protein